MQKCKIFWMYSRELQVWHSFRSIVSQKHLKVKLKHKRCLLKALWRRGLKIDWIKSCPWMNLTSFLTHTLLTLLAWVKCLLDSLHSRITCDYSVYFGSISRRHLSDPCLVDVQGFTQQTRGYLDSGAGPPNRRLKLECVYVPKILKKYCKHLCTFCLVKKKLYF